MEKRKKLIMIIIIIIVSVLVLIDVIFLVGIYKYQWTDKYTLTFAKVIPVPAAMVNNSWVKYAAWQENVQGLDHFYAQQDELQLDLVDKPDSSEIKKQELERMINFKILEIIAKEYDVSYSQEDVDREFEETIIPQAAGGEEEVKQTLQDLYGWEIADFKEKVLSEIVIRKKINEHIADEELQSEKKAQAEDVLAKINSEELTFESAAKQFSEDASAAQEGDLGFFEKGVMVKNFEDAAFALEEGQVSEVIRTVYGYHLIKCEAIEMNDEGEVERVHARHILIKLFSVDDLIAQKKEEVKIRNFFE